MNGRVCEDESGCQGSAYSWSAEHQNSVLCVKHYKTWLKERNVINAKNILSGLTPDEKKQLLEALK